MNKLSPITEMWRNIDSETATTCWIVISANNSEATLQGARILDIQGHISFAYQCFKYTVE